MKGLLYRLTRDLHLYFGLFISPFVLVFSVSVFFFVHAGTPIIAPETTRVVSSLDLPANLSTLSGRPLVDALKPVLEGLNVRGEIGFVQKHAPEETLLIPVSIPGRAITVRLHLGRREATVVTRETGLADALMTLHKSPGGHGPDIRMNWFAMKAWRWFADATVYLTLFITISGVYLWAILRAERRVAPTPAKAPDRRNRSRLGMSQLRLVLTGPALAFLSPGPRPICHDCQGRF